jgi:polygalacturonase
MRKIFLSVLAFVGVVAFAQNPYDKYYTDDLPCAVEHVQPVIIPDYTVNIVDFGGVNDGVTDNTEAFAEALKHLEKQGGGHLIVPDGKWLTGPIKLISNFDLHLEDNAVILGSTNKELYVQKND